MNATVLFMGALVLALLGLAYWRGAEMPVAGLLAGGRALWHNLPLVLLGFAIAGLIQVLVPGELISRWLGVQSGAKGVLIACLAGGLVPGPPYAVFPLVAGLYKAGAGLGPVVGFISAWSLWSVARLPIEMALVDPKVALVRYGVTFVVPPLAGLLASVLTRPA